MVACGGAPGSDGAPAEESLGAQAAAVCAGASVTTLTIADLSSYGGELAGNGSWAVSYPANAIKLEYYVDGVQRSVDERTGTSGTWYFSTTGITCGSHTFVVKAYPLVIDSAGNRTTCTDSLSSLSQSVTQACPTASLSCSRTSSSYITCTGSGSGGTGSYTAYWQQVTRSAYTNEDLAMGWTTGSFTKSFRCPQTTSNFADRLEIQFKVSDSSGMQSPLESSVHSCAAGSLPY